MLWGGIRAVASGPFATTVTGPHAAARGSSMTNRLNGGSLKSRARPGPTLKTAPCAVPSVKLATTSAEAPAVPQMTYSYPRTPCRG